MELIPFKPVDRADVLSTLGKVGLLTARSYPTFSDLLLYLLPTSPRPVHSLQWPKRPCLYDMGSCHLFGKTLFSTESEIML